MAGLVGRGPGAPPPHREGDDAGAFGRELETAGGGEIEPVGLADDTREAADPQTLLHHQQNGPPVAGLDIDHAIRMQPHRREGRREQVGSHQAPQDRAAQPGEHARHEQRRGGPIGHVPFSSGHLVQGAEQQPASRKAVVDLGHAERQGRPQADPLCLEAVEAGAQLLDDG